MKEVLQKSEVLDKTLYNQYKDLLDDMKKNGGFIPGIRAGKPTTEYLTSILGKLTWFGAIFLSLIAILPMLMRFTSVDISAFAMGNKEKSKSKALIIIAVAAIAAIAYFGYTLGYKYYSVKMLKLKRRKLLMIVKKDGSLQEFLPEKIILLFPVS